MSDDATGMNTMVRSDGPGGRELPVRDPHRRYAVYATAKTFRYPGCVFADVPLTFFRQLESDEPDLGLDPRAFYPGLDPHDAVYQLESELELFTEAEADALIAWLARDGDVVGVKKGRHEALLERCMPYGAMAVGGDSDFWTVDEEPSYDLPFRAWAWAHFRVARVVDVPPPRLRPTYATRFLGQMRVVAESVLDDMAGDAA